MTKVLLILSIIFALSVSKDSLAAVELSTNFISEAHLQRVIMTYQHTSSSEAVKNICDSSPFIRNPCTEALSSDVEAFGIDEIGPDSILRDRLSHSISAG